MLGVHHSAICTSDVTQSLRFWRDGLGLRELFDFEFTGDWPELFGAKSDQLRSIFLGDPQTPEAGIVELVEFAGADDQLPVLSAPRHGFFLLSFQREVDETLSALAALDARSPRGPGGRGGRTGASPSRRSSTMQPRHRNSTGCRY